MADVEVIAGYRVHPAASLFPLIDGEEFEMLVTSIEERGVLHPIIVRGYELIDGRNRLRAIERIREKQGDIPVVKNIPIKQWDDAWGNVCEWIWDTNGNRRQMTQDAMAICSAKIFDMIMAENEARKKAAQFKPGVSPNPGGKPKKPEVETKSSPPEPGHTIEKDARSTVGQVAARANVSHHKARQAIAVVKAVEAGELPAQVVDEIVTGKTELKKVAPKKPKKAKAPKPKPETQVRPAPVNEDWPEYDPKDHVGSSIEEFHKCMAKWSNKQILAVGRFLEIWDPATKNERNQIRFVLQGGEGVTVKGDDQGEGCE